MASKITKQFVARMKRDKVVVGLKIDRKDHFDNCLKESGDANNQFKDNGRTIQVTRSVNKMISNRIAHCDEQGGQELTMNNVEATKTIDLPKPVCSIQIEGGSCL